MTKQNIDDIIRTICPNDEDFEKPCISPAYLKKELEALALEQEPCEDAISRQTVLKIIDGWYEQNRDTENIEDLIVLITYMDSVNPQKSGHWIPVRERLPEDFQRVLVTVERYNGDKVARVAEYNGRKRIFKIIENHEQWEVGEKGLLAWMPLPEPYKTESENT